MNLSLLFKIGSIVLSLLMGLLTAGNAVSTAYNADGSGLATTAGTGLAAVLFAALSWAPWAIGKFWPDGAAANVPAELTDVITAITDLAANPRDWNLQRWALIQILELAFSIAQAVVKDPAIDAAIANALELVKKAFDPVERARKLAAAPAAGDQVFVDTSKAPQSFGEALAIAEAKRQ